MVFLIFVELINFVIELYIFQLAQKFDYYIYTFDICDDVVTFVYLSCYNFKERIPVMDFKERL